MSGTPNDFDNSPNRDAAGESQDAVIADRVQDLTWALIEEVITEDQFEMLDSLLLADEGARKSYLGCMQLHADLTTHFARKNQVGAEASTKSPVLGFLGDSQPLDFPAADDATR